MTLTRSRSQSMLGRYLSAILILATLLLAVPAADSGQPTCAWCKKAISQGGYVEFNGHLYHADCYKQHVAPRCTVCNKPIDGKYIIHDGHNYHEACYNDQAAVHCDLCDEIISGQYLTTFWGERYCQKHQGKTPECTYCGRFLGDRSNRGGERYADGRCVCNLCIASAVNDEERARQIMEEIRGRLQQLGIKVDIRDLPLHLVDRAGLAKQFGGDMSHNSGFCRHDYRYIGDKLYDQRFEIFILNGMPRMHFITTIAHELMHVWQYQNAPLQNQPAFCEGSCNYAAWLVLQSIGGDEARYQMLSLEQATDPVYGGGFRRVKKLAGDRGRNGWLSTLQSYKDLPTGY